MKPFGSCGFELLRVLGLEFSLGTRTEAICLRSEVMKKDYRVDTKGTHVVSDLLRAMAVETSRYDKLISTLPPTVPRSDLTLNESDQALILIRNLPADARQLVLLHAQDDGLTALREAGLKYERQQRLYSELGAVAGKLRQVQEGESGAESDDEGALNAVGAGDKSKRCTKCGKRHETSKCRTDMTNITCFKCGKKGHIGANCKVKTTKGSDGKSSKDSGKSSKDSGKKGKMFEVTEGDGEQPEDETALDGADQVTMVLTGPCEVECTFEILDMVAVDSAEGRFQDTVDATSIFQPKPETTSFWNHRVSWEFLGTLGTVFAVFMHVIAFFMICCGIGMVFKDVAVDFDRKQLFCGQFEPVLDWLYECEGDGLLDCGCTRRHWTDPWLGFRSKPHWKDLHGLRLLSDCTLDETWHETPVSMEYCETPLRETELLSEVPNSDACMCTHALDRAVIPFKTWYPGLLWFGMSGTCCCCVVCAVDCIHADLLPHDMVCCCCCTHDEISYGVCAVDCMAGHLPHEMTSEVQHRERSDHHCLVSDPLLPLLNSTLQEETDWWLIDSGASVSVISERNVRNYKVVSREPYTSSAGFFAANGSPVKMSERVKLEVTLQTVRNGETQNTRVLIACLVGDTKSNILSTGSLVQNGWAIQMSSEEFSMKHSSGLECQLVEWGGCPWISCKGVSGVSPISSGELNVVRYGIHPDELHRARGHMPYDPNCKHCVAAKSVGQHRRKAQDSEGGIIVDVHSDFFFIGKEKFLVVADLGSHMFGAIWMSPNSDVNHRNLSYWLREFGCLDGNPQGVLHVYTDDEVAVGAVFQDAKLDKPVKVTRAAPQSPETNGLAERCVRTLKETLVVLRMDLQSSGLDIQRTGAALHELVLYISHMSNMYVGVHGTTKSAREFLEGRKQQTPVTSSFGAVVLCELPDSVREQRKTELPRFLEGAYLHPAFGSKAHECIVSIDGECKRIRPKSIKLVMPLRWELSLVRSLFVQTGEVVEQPADASPDDLVVRTSERPPETEPTCPRTGPPNSWFEQHGLYTPNCGACKNLELGLGRSGKSHSARCCRAYVEWLKGERAKLGVGQPVGDRAQVEERSRGPVIDSPVPSPSTPLEDFGQGEGEVLPVPGSVFNDEEVKTSEPVFDDSMGDVGPPGASASSSRASRKRVATETEETTVVTGDTFVGTSDSRGVKRPAESVETPSFLEDESERPRGVKRGIDEPNDGMECVFDAEVMDGLWTHEDLCSIVTYPCLVEESSAASIMFGNNPQSEVIDFCGVKAKVWVPHEAVDDSTMAALPGDKTLDGMKTEIKNLTRCAAGKPRRYEEAQAFCAKHNTKVLTSRWVTTHKIIDGQDGVRSRIVVKDFASTKAKSSGVSSPTPSTEGLKSVLALAAQEKMFLTGLDVSAAFMHTPLRSHCKYMVKMPLSLTWEDGSPIYLELSRALNGLRPASGEWLHYVTSILKPLNLTADEREPCILAGPEGLVVIYVDDILIASSREGFAKKIHELLNSVVPTKVTGFVHPSKGGQLKFVGRILKRLPHEPQLFISVEPTYLDSTFKDYQIGSNWRTKSAGVAVPNIRTTLEQPGESQPLSNEAHAKYRRALGKLAWLSQTRDDLHIMVCILSTGQSAPNERHERALRQVLRWLFHDGLVCLTFPSDHEIGSEDYLLTGYCDASHAPMRSTKRKGISGAAIVFCNCLIKSFARHQTAVSLSTCESELFGIQAVIQDLLGLRQLVLRLVESLGGIQSRLPKGVIVKTDSASARDLLDATDVPRRSRHTEVRIYWVREQLESQRVVIVWMKGTENPSDMMTKVLDTRNFKRYRELLGFVAGEGILAISGLPAQMMCETPETGALSAVRKPGGTDGLVIELCCDEHSSLRTVCEEWGITYFGITEKAEEASTVKWLRDQVDEERRQGAKHVHLHASCPCTAGSPIRHLKGDGKYDFRFAEMEDIVKRLPEYEKIADGMSLEWPVCNSLWKCDGVEKRLKTMKLTHEGLVALCRVGYVSSQGLPVGKRLKFVSNRPGFASFMAQFQECFCATHAPLNQVDWTMTGLYNRTLANRILKGILASR